MRPAASVIIPAFNRPDALRRAVAAVLAQEAGDLELLVVDDGGDMPAADALRDLTDPRLRILRHANRGPAYTRNRGAAEARAPLLAFTDDDCAPRPDWLSRLLDRAAATPGAMIGGHTRNALAGDLRAQASQDLIDFLYGRLNAAASGGQFLTSNNMLVPADAFKAIGGFDERFPLAAGEDRQFCRRWVASGRAIALEPEAVVDHFHALTLGKFWRQHRNYGRGAYQYHVRAAGDDVTATADQRGGLGMALAIVGWPLKHGGSLPNRLMRSGLLGIAQLATAVGYRAERRGDKSRTAA